MAKSCSSVKDRLGIRLGGASFMGSILYLNTNVNYNVTCCRCGARWRAMTGVPRPRRFCEDWGGMSGDLGDSALWARSPVALIEGPHTSQRTALEVRLLSDLFRRYTGVNKGSNL